MKILSHIGNRIPTPNSHRIGVCIGVVAALYVAMYVPAINAPFLWDDKQVLVNNIHIESLENISSAFTNHYLGTINDEHNTTPYYRPFSLAVLFLERAACQLSPAGYHLFHLGWHLISGLLLLFIANRIFRYLSPKPSPSFYIEAIFVPILFLVLPYTVDAVMFLTNLGDLMVLCSLLACILFFLKYLELSFKRFLIPIFALSLLASGSKETGVGTVFILALIYLLLLPNTNPKRALIGMGSSLLGVMVYSGARFMVLKSANPLDVTVALTRFFSDLALSLRWALVPHPMALEEPAATSFYDLWWWMGLGITLSAIALTVLFRKKRPFIPLLLLSWILLISPSLIGIQHNLIFSLRYLYVPGAAVACAGGIVFFRSSKMIRFGLGGLCVALLFLSLIRLHSWQDSVSFWSLEVDRHPESASALVNLGAAVEDQNDFEKAMAIYIEAAKASEKELQIDTTAYIYFRQGYLWEQIFDQKDKALASYTKAVKIYPTAKTWIAIGNIHAFDRNWSKAETAFKKAEQLAPNNVEVLISIAGALGAQGQFDEAIAYIRKGKRIASNAHAIQAELDHRLQVLLNYKNRQNQGAHRE